LVAEIYLDANILRSVSDSIDETVFFEHYLVELTNFQGLGQGPKVRTQGKVVIHDTSG